MADTQTVLVFTGASGAVAVALAVHIVVAVHGAIPALKRDFSRFRSLFTTKEA